MDFWLLGAVIFLIPALGIAFGNYQLLKGALHKTSARILLVFLLREIINLVFLCAVYFIAPYTPWNRMTLLIAAVIGLTIGLFGFTFSLLKNISSQEQGGENTHG